MKEFLARGEPVSTIQSVSLGELCNLGVRSAGPHGLLAKSQNQRRILTSVAPSFFCRDL